MTHRNSASHLSTLSHCQSLNITISVDYTSVGLLLHLFVKFPDNIFFFFGVLRGLLLICCSLMYICKTKNLDSFIRAVPSHMAIIRQKEKQH